MADDRDGLAAALAALQPEIRMMLAEDLPVDRQRCEEAFAAQRWGQLREHAHRVKGSAQFCHLDTLCQVCLRIEEKAGADAAPEPSDMESFSAEVGRVLVALGA
ncbi:MAG TPA: Hpt domain-containing protein [Gammaproteobacteria bacterium]|jgi:HPt (histidine-containing phosphotransfer) domain-containing protein